MLYRYILFIFIISFIYVQENNLKHSKIYIPKQLPVYYESVLTGLDILELSNFHLLNNKNIALVINHTSVNRFDKNIRSDEDLYKNGGKIFEFTLERVEPMVNKVLKMSKWECLMKNIIRNFSNCPKVNFIIRQ